MIYFKSIIYSKLNICWILLLTCFTLNAQTLSKGFITGTIVDEKKNSFPGVVVILQNAKDSSFYKSALSDQNGNFKIDQITGGSYKIKITILGYETLFKSNIVINSQNPSLELGAVQLSHAVKTLNTVNITGQKDFIERKADKIIVNLNNGMNSGSIFEVLDRLPGVQVNPDDQINLNGRSVRIYIDGKATPLSSEALASLLKGMSPTSIQKIELIAHPSSKYDADGRGGIINIVRKRNVKDGLNGNVYGGTGQGEYGKYNGGVNLNYKGKSYNLFFNADLSYNKYFVNNDLQTDFYDNNNFLTSQTKTRINSVRSNRTYTPNVGVDFYLSKKTTLSLSSLVGVQLFNKNANSITNGLNSDNSPSNQDLFDNLVHTKSVNFAPSLHFATLIDTSGKEFTVDLDYYNYSNNSNQHNLLTNFDSTGTVPTYARSLFDLDRKFSVYSAKADYTHPFKNGGNFEAGWKSSYVTSYNNNMLYNLVGDVPIIDPTQNDFFKYSENINALYADYSKTVKKFSYQLGLRGENTSGQGVQVQNNQTFNRNYFQIFPSAYFDYKLDESNGLNLSLDKKTDRPTYENLDPLVRIINSNNYLQGNPNLQPVTAYNSSLTYSFKNVLYATFNYSIDFHDFTYITSTIDSNKITTTKPDNNKYTQNFSFILAFNKQVNSWWYTSSNINLSQKSFTANDNISKLNSSGILAFNFDTYDSFSITKKFSFMVLFKYRGRSIDKNINYDPYFTFTTGVRQQIFGTRGSVSLSVSDVLHTYKSSYVQNSLAVTQYWDNHYETTVARLSFTYSFGGKVKKTKTGTAADDEKRRTNIKEN